MAAAAPVVPPLVFFFLTWVIPGISCMHIAMPPCVSEGQEFR
jgi:hypothetical protein